MFTWMDRLRDQRIVDLEIKVEALQLQIDTLTALLPMVDDTTIEFKTTEQVDWDRLLENLLAR